MKFVTMANLNPLGGTLRLDTSVWMSPTRGTLGGDPIAVNAPTDGPQPGERDNAKTPYERPEVFKDYAFLTENYTARQLTYPSNVLNAFCGVTSAIAKQMPQDFICGLPSRLLDLALLWMPADRNQSRKTPSEPKGPLLPTWSGLAGRGRSRIPAWFRMAS